MDIQSIPIKFMLVKLFLVLKIILIKKWFRDNNMLFKLLDQQEKDM